MNKSNIEERVMASVGLIYAARSLVSMTALKLYVLAFSLGGIATLVSVSNVVSNFTNALARGGVEGIVMFVLSAVLSTTLLVQVALVLGALALVSLLTPFFRAVRSRRALA